MKAKMFVTKKGEMPLQECLITSKEKDLGIETGLVNIYPNIEYQTIKGFGGAFTEASAITLNKLSKENREKIIKMYFDPKEGIGYNLGRVHINSCDFSLGNYTCVDENDETLESFQINRDKLAVIPMIKDAMKYSDIEIIASPWSPPAYMKTNGEMNHGGKLKEEYFELWAEYYVKFIKAYQAEGISISKISVQNEPKAVQRWDSCVFTAEEERDFVKNYLGQKMKENQVEILFWDHNKERVMDRALVMLEDEVASQYVNGIAVHWYSGDHFEQLEMFHKLYPTKDIVFLEGCYEYSLGKNETTKIGEKYAHDMIGNFNNYCNAFVDWNLLLDEKGGPNHVGNYCDAPIMADVNKNQIIINDSYYYIAHFSKFVKKGAKRIGCSKFTSKLEIVSFKNPDKSIVSIVLNETDNDVDFAFRIEGEIVSCVATAHSIATYVFEE